jgi:arylsulfatase A-like enzyme
MDIKGIVETVDQLPDHAQIGDVYAVRSEGFYYVYQAKWVLVRKLIDQGGEVAPPISLPDGHTDQDVEIAPPISLPDPESPTYPMEPPSAGVPVQPLPGEPEAPAQPLPDEPITEEQKRKLGLGHLIRRRRQRRKSKPNILVIMSDDVGISNLSCYTHGIQGFRTANIDRIAAEGAIFTDAYGQNSCTAGRSAFILGQCPFRTGLTAVGMPGSEHGIPDWTPTLADLLKEEGYRTGQFGKNHLGDWNKHLPTVHGFDEFYGNLYHLNTSEEPEGEFYPKDPAFLASYGPRGVLDCQATDRPPPDIREDPRFGPQGNQRIKDTGPLTRARMPDYDDKEIAPRAESFIKEAARAKEPFFCWVCPSRCHVWTRLKKESEGVTGIGLFGDAILEHDKFVGRLLELLDKLKIADDTIVIWTTDNGAEHASWPDGGNTPFHGEKGTTFEGGFRVPFVMRWPGVIEPGTWENAIFSFEDIVPTLMASAGNPNVVAELKTGRKSRRLRDKTWKVHLDGFDFMPYFLGEVDRAPREYFLYFGQSGQLNAVRWNDWKVSFAHMVGNIFDALREVPANPTINHLRSDPYEVMHLEAGQYMKFYGDQLWLFVPVGQSIAEFVQSLADWPKQLGPLAGPADLNYATSGLANLVLEFKEPRRLFHNFRD